MWSDVMLIIHLRRQFGHLTLKLHSRTVDLKITENKLENLKRTPEDHFVIVQLCSCDVIIACRSFSVFPLARHTQECGGQFL